MPLSGGSGGRRTSAAVPGYSSVRLQKAYRLNGVEGIRLQWRLQILNRQKVRAVRLVNQDIRLTRIALEHIHISSGVSVDVDDIDDDVADRRSGSHVDGPMFLYGERQVSRKQGRGRRAQSAAAVEAGGRRSAPTGDITDAATKRPLTALPVAAEATAFDAVRARAAAHFSAAQPPSAMDNGRAAVAPSRGQPPPPSPPSPPPSGIAKTNLGNFYSLTPLAIGRAVASSTALDSRAQAGDGDAAGVAKPTAARATAVSVDAARRPKHPVASVQRPVAVDAAAATAAATAAAVATGSAARSRRQTSEAHAAAAAATLTVTPPTKAAATAKTVTVEARAARVVATALASVTTAGSENKPSPLAAAASPGGVDAMLSWSNVAATAAEQPSVAVVSRAQRTAETVQKARAQSGRAKRFRNSVVGDPLLDQTLPMAEKKRKQKEAALQHRKNVQRTADASVAEKVRDYLVKHPLIGGGRRDAGGGDDSDADGDDDVFEKAAAVAEEAAVGTATKLRRSRSIAWAS